MHITFSTTFPFTTFPFSILKILKRKFPFRISNLFCENKNFFEIFLKYFSYFRRKFPSEILSNTGKIFYKNFTKNFWGKSGTVSDGFSDGIGPSEFPSEMSAVSPAVSAISDGPHPSECCSATSCFPTTSFPS